MVMVNVAIIDDDKIDRHRLKEALNYVSSKKGVAFQTKEFSSGETFIFDYKSSFDLVLMDIEMSGLNGIETAKKLREIDKDIIIVFVTNMAQLAINGYEVEALDFIVKPITNESFFLKMVRVLSRIKEKTDDAILVKTNEGFTKVYLDRLKYVECQGHTLIYHTLDININEYATISSCEKRLTSSNFVKCNRGYIVNMNYISTIKKRASTIIVGTEEIVVSRQLLKSLITKYAAFIGG